MARMKVGDLLEILEEVKEKYGEDIEVRLAHQPRWAFEYSVEARCGVAKGPKSSYDDSKVNVFYLAEGTQIGYLPDGARFAIGWSEPDYDEDGELETESDYETFGDY